MQRTLKKRKKAYPGLKMGKPVWGGTLTGNIRMHRWFHSRILGNKRNILVYLPPGYSEYDSKRYPVLYVNDGQNAFDARTSVLGNDWGIDDTAEYLINEGLMKEIIIVAVYNTPHRTDEYTPIYDPCEGGGNADEYAAFLILELMPFINKRYKTSQDPLETGIMGSSFGGLNALYIGWKYSNVFSIVGAVSPSLWFGENYLIDYISEDNWRTGPSRIWLCMGTEEDDDDDEIFDLDEQFCNDYETDKYGHYEQTEPFFPEFIDENAGFHGEFETDTHWQFDDYSEESPEKSYEENNDEYDEYYEEYYSEEHIDYSFDYNIEDLRRMKEVLLAKGYEPEFNLFYREVEGAGHNEWAWGQRTPEILMTLFPNHE
jgi:predicted alpha/beta superfamily hydrolase